MLLLKSPKVEIHTGDDGLLNSVWGKFVYIMYSASFMKITESFVMIVKLGCFNDRNCSSVSG